MQRACVCVRARTCVCVCVHVSGWKVGPGEIAWWSYIEISHGSFKNGLDSAVPIILNTFSSERQF